MSPSFVQARPREGADPARLTEVRVLYDGGALYVGARMQDTPEAIADQLVRRDGRGAFDFFRVELDPNDDNLTGYLFQVSAAGAERDAFLFDDSRADDSFDAVWASRVGRDSAGWTAELRIPLSQIDFQSADTAQTWGVNFTRRRLASNSTAMLALRSRTESGRVSQFGRLRGIRIPGSGRALEIAPYVSARTRRAPADPDNPFFDGSSVTPRAGVRANWSFRSNFTLDATVNPDFGQVEVDPAVVNLTAFETFFAEKRPFFTEDARLFDFGLSGANRRLFFSRRIGREPRGRPPEGARFTDVPGATTILGATKVTGRTSEGLSLGALAAVTAEEKGRAFVPGEGTERFTAHPRSEYAVLRAEQDLRNGASSVGGILVGLRRDLPQSGSLGRLADAELAGGVDVQHQWGGARSRRYRLWGYLSGSWVTGSPEAITRIQRDANHYFQRPDADYVSVDSSATHLGGREWRLQLERQSASHWTWRVWMNEASPEFVVDGVGFAGSTLPRIDLGGQLRYQDISPGALFRRWSLRLNTFHNFRHSLADDPFDPGQWADSRESGRFLLGGRFTFRSNWRMRLGGSWEPSAATERETRGGPLMRRPGSAALSASLRTDPRDPVNLRSSVRAEERFGAGERLTADLQLELRPTPNWEVRLGPRFEHQDDRAQYVTATDAVPFEPTFGRRYVFAEVIREELGLITRLNAAFTPNLSLQLFAQTLLSSGDFVRYKQLARPRSFEFLRFPEGEAAGMPGGHGTPAVRCEGGRTCVSGGKRFVDLDGDGRPDTKFSARDFSLRSLRGNAVLRWEYSSGSELFVVWEQNRRGRSDAGRFDLGGDLSRLVETPPENVLIVKVRHHLGL